MRGELPNSFWMPDAQGMVVATDSAFMSTSRHRDTPVQYMDKAGDNLLWELQPSKASDAAFHHGADISFLSQFSGEGEVVFPPCTMLVLLSNEDLLGRAPDISSKRNVFATSREESPNAATLDCGPKRQRICRGKLRLLLIFAQWLEEGENS